MGETILCGAATGMFQRCGCDTTEIMPGVWPHCAQLHGTHCGRGGRDCCKYTSRERPRLSDLFAVVDGADGSSQLPTFPRIE